MAKFDKYVCTYVAIIVMNNKHCNLSIIIFLCLPQYFLNVELYRNSKIRFTWVNNNAKKKTFFFIESGVNMNNKIVMPHINRWSTCWLLYIDLFTTFYTTIDFSIYFIIYITLVWWRTLIWNTNIVVIF